MTTSFSSGTTSLSPCVQGLNATYSKSTITEVPENENLAKETNEDDDYMLMNSGVKTTSIEVPNEQKSSRFFCTILESSPHNSESEEEKATKVLFLRKSRSKSPKKDDLLKKTKKSLSPLKNKKKEFEDDYGIIVPAASSLSHIQNLPTLSSISPSPQQRSCVVNNKSQQPTRKISEITLRRTSPQQNCLIKPSQCNLKKHSDMASMPASASVIMMRVAEELLKRKKSKINKSNCTVIPAASIPIKPTIQQCDYALVEATPVDMSKLQSLSFHTPTSAEKKSFLKDTKK